MECPTILFSSTVISTTFIGRKCHHIEGIPPCGRYDMFILFHLGIKKPTWKPIPTIENQPNQISQARVNYPKNDYWYAPTNRDTSKSAGN